MRRRECLGVLGRASGAALPLTAVSQLAQAAAPECQPLLGIRYDEFHLISRRLSAKQYENLHLWDERRRVWQKQPAGHSVLHAPIVVLHFWADYCAPCRQEFPWLRELVREVGPRYKGQVQVVFVSETSSSAAMAQFIDQNQAALPWSETAHYLDTHSDLLMALGNGLPSGSLSLPTTLLCDPYIVRQGLIGSLVHRRADLRGAIDRLLQTQSSTP